MNPTAFDRISRRFAERRLSRRQALATGGAGLATAGLTAAGLAPVAAQDATPESVPAKPRDGEKTTYLFVQSFHSGSIVPIEGEDGRYTVTLEQGTGQTIYFADRPSRDVGATDTTQFLEGLGFPEDNPPNAALIVETAPGETDVAVVELFNPTIAPDTGTVTYDVEVLENWQDDLELGFREAAADLAALAPEFGAAHLLIDDCPQIVLLCTVDDHSGFVVSVDTCFDRYVCRPCETSPEANGWCATHYYWDAWCTESFPEYCKGECWSAFEWKFERCDRPALWEPVS